MPRTSTVEDNKKAVSSKNRKQQRGVPAAADRDEAAAQRARRLRRKALAAKVAAHWKSFAREGIAEARARAHADKLPPRRALARWRAGAAALRAARLRCAADAGRRRFLAESRGFAKWRAVARASAAARAARRDSARCARAGRARVLATSALRRWREAASLATARRGMEGAALRAWASGRVYSGLAGLRRHALKRRLGLFLVDRGMTGRRRLLGRKGLAALEAALLRAGGERDLVAEALAGRVRVALARWSRRASVQRARKAIRAEEAFVQASRLLPGKLRRAFWQWRRFSATRQHYRNLVADIATVSRRSPAVSAKDRRRPAPAPRPATTATTAAAAAAAATAAAAAAVAAGRARAAACLRRWRRAVSRRRKARAHAGLAKEFRDHVLLLRHHEHWKAFARSGRAAAALAAAAERLGRRARMRRALLALGRAADESAAERDRARPRLREAFLAWDGVSADGLRKRERRAEEGRERDRRTKRRALAAWLRRTQATMAARGSLGVGGRQHRRRSLRESLRGWAIVGAEMGLRRVKAAASHRHADRRRLETGVRDWRAAAAGIALRRSANTMARGQACKSLASRTLRAWRERADLQAARKAVFCARVASAATATAEGKLRRSLTRWQEVHGSARVATITLLRADGHARRKVLGKIWRAWGAVRDLQKRRKVFRAKVKARRRLSLQRGAFSALVAAAEAGRREREKVSAALLLWKLHTQGKAFAALAAHRLRRRWKQDRARRAVRWRREHLIKDGALRWAATADAIAASRISSAASREGNKAARRWEAAGRCARHWRRVAAARGMERRARGSSKPRSDVAAPRSPSNGGFPGDFGALLAAERCVREGGAGFIGGTRGGAFAGRFDLGAPGPGPCGGGGRGGSRSRLLGDAAAERCFFRSRGDAGGVGNENSGGNDGLFLRHSDSAAAAGGEPATRVALRPPCSSPTHQENRTAVAQGDRTPAAPVAAVADRRGGSSDAFQHGYENTGTLANRPGGSLAQRPAASWAGVWAGGGPGASFKPSGLADSPAERGTSLSSPVPRHPSLSHTTRARATADYRRPRSIGAAAVAGATATTRDGEPLPPSFKGSDLDGASLGEGKEGQAPSTTTIAVGDLTQLPSPSVPAFPGVFSRGDREAGETAAAIGDAVAGAQSVGVLGGDGGDGGGRRRPAPRRPLELLLDETARYSAAASDGGRRRGGIGGSKGVAPSPPPLSTWVVGEMNRLFGVRHPGASDLGAALGGDRGHSGEMLRSLAGEDRRPTVRSSSREQGLSWSAGAHAGRETGDGGILGHHHHPRRHSNTQLPRDEPLLRAATQQQENIHIAGGEATWSNHASVPPPPPPHALRLGKEHTPWHGQSGPTLGATSAPSWSSSPPTVAADARREGSRRAAHAPVTGRQTPTSAATLRQDASSKDGEDGTGGAEEGRRSERSPPPSADPPLLTKNLDVTGVSTSGSRAIEVSAVPPASCVSQGAVPTPGPHETGVSAAGAPVSSECQAARLAAGVGVGCDAIVPRRSSVVQPESASLRKERALEARVADAERRLLALKEHARQRRRGKRELAALQQALAEQEGKQSSGSRGSRGDARGGGGGVGHARDGGAIGVGVGGGGGGGGGEENADSIPARAGDGRSDNPCAGGESTGRRTSPPPASGTLRSIETNAKQGSTATATTALLGARASDGGRQASPSSWNPPRDPDPAPQGEATPQPRDDGNTNYSSSASPTESDTATLSRRALLVRLGFVRARLEAGGAEGEEGGGLRPVAESLRREVAELAKSGAAAAAVAEGEGAAGAGVFGE